MTNFVAPIILTDDNQVNSNGLSWNFKTNQLDRAFNGCFSYNKIYHTTDNVLENNNHELFPLKISVNCTWRTKYECPDCLCHCTWEKNEYDDQVILLLNEGNNTCLMTAKNETLETKVRLNLVCTIYDVYNFNGRAYGFTQPITLNIPAQYLYQQSIDNASTIISTVQRKRTLINEISTTSSKNTELDISISMIFLIVIIILFGVSISLFIYCRIKRRNAVRRLMLDENTETKLLNIKCVDHQECNSCNTKENDRYDNVENEQLPDWLKKRPEMIYDTSCIEKGKELGHGNFGAVFEGRIRFGNAM